MSLSLPLTEDDYDDTVTAFEDFLDENKAVLPALS